MGCPLPEDNNVLIEHLSGVRRHLNQPAIVGVYLDLLHHLNLCPYILHRELTVLMDEILDEFEEGRTIHSKCGIYFPKQFAQYNP